uniref:Uncharacterized protein n=1 Tax=Monopterus albus TaxID=43700 RepID=A0A3Q3K9J3_MONAL
MVASHCVWIAPFFLSMMTVDTGVFGRAVNTQGVPSHSPKTADESLGLTLRTDALRRWRRGMAEKHRERCAELAAPLLENAQQVPEDNATVLHLRVRPFSPRASQGPVFPEKPLFSFVRQVYHCCQEGLHCRSVKGIQGHVEFLFTREILSLTVMKAELHLQLSNPQHLHIQLVFPTMAKRNLATSLRSRGNMVELRVDLLFLFQNLQEAAGGARGGPNLVNMRQVVLSSRGGPPGERPAPNALQDTDGDGWEDGGADTLPAMELGLVLGCSQAGLGVSCATGGVHLSHTPFMALYYR